MKQKFSAIKCARLTRYLLIEVKNTKQVFMYDFNILKESIRVDYTTSIEVIPDRYFEEYDIVDETYSDLLECKATFIEKEQGLDLADYLIKFDYREFVKLDKGTFRKDLEIE